MELVPKHGVHSDHDSMLACNTEIASLDYYGAVYLSDRQ